MPETVSLHNPQVIGIHIEWSKGRILLDTCEIQCMSSLYWVQGDLVMYNHKRRSCTETWTSTEMLLEDTIRKIFAPSRYDRPSSARRRCCRSKECKVQKVLNGTSATLLSSSTIQNVSAHSKNAINLFIPIRMAGFFLEPQCLKPLQPRNTATQPTALHAQSCRHPDAVYRSTGRYERKQRHCVS